MKNVVAFLSVTASVISIVAGIYLLARSSQTITIGGQSGQSWFAVLARGIGLYFLARGIWMFGEAMRSEAVWNALTKLGDLLEPRADESGGAKPFPEP